MHAKATNTEKSAPSQRAPVALPAGRRLWVLMSVALVVVGLTFVSAGVAHAGEWVQVSCVNPDGTAAGSSGWYPMIAGGGYGSNTGTACGPDTAMYAILSDDAAVAVGSAETLRYVPPAGSTLNGGEVNVGLFADGGGFNASGTAVLYSPEYAYVGSNVFFQCAEGLTPCSGGGNDFSGAVAIPAGRGGDLYVSAGCGGAEHAVCSEHPSFGAWSLVQVGSAQLRLSNSSTPTASSVSGTLLEAGAHGDAELIVAAADPDGPGVYEITVQADGQTLYSATPETNEGKCVAVGQSAGALMFDAAQPCKQSEQIEVPIDTTSLSNGQHTLRVSVTDAAGNSSVVLDRAITTANPVSQPPVSNAVQASTDARIRLAGSKLYTRPYARRALSVSGHLETSAGTPIGSAELTITEQPASAATVARASSVTTGGDGSFTLRIPPGPSRTIVIGYRARPSDPTFAAQASVSETVHAGLYIAVTPRETSSAGTITIRGAVAGPIPRAGLTVELLVHYRGQWVPFRDAHVTRNGRLRVRYQFQGATGRFPFRAKVIGEQGGYPYATGESNTVTVSAR